MYYICFLFLLQEFSLDSGKGRTDTVSSLAGYRRAKSLDRRATETLMTVRTAPSFSMKLSLFKDNHVYCIHIDLCKLQH